MAQDANSETWLITGASRGIGLALAEAHCRRGGGVIAGYRNEPGSALQALRASYQDRVELVRCDISETQSVAGAASQIKRPIDVLVLNAAVFGERKNSFRGLDYDDMLSTINVNALGAIRVADAFTPLMKNTIRPRIIAISSLMGAMSQNNGVGAVAYRTSKAALHKAMQLIANELAADKISVACVRPGHVRTEMGGPDGALSPEESAQALLGVIDSMQSLQHCQFLDLTGEPLQW